MRIEEVLYECEVVYLDEDGKEIQLDEGAKRAFKRVNKTIKRYYRCKGGPKDGKLVSTPGACAQRKDPKKVRRARKTMRVKKNIIQRKSKITKNKAVSKMVTKMNKRLAGK